MAQTKRDLEQLVAATKQSATKAKDTQTAYNSFLTNLIRDYDGNIPYSVDARTTDFQNAASTGSLNASTLNSLLGNEPGDWRPKRGELANMDTLWKLAVTQADYMDFARKNGVFDTEQYAFDRGSVSLPSTSYLQQLYDQMSDPAYKAKATTQDLSKMNRSSWGWFYDGLRNGDIGLSTQIANISQPGDDLLAYADHMITGNKYVDPETMTEEERNAWRTAALERYNYVGLGNEQTWIDLSNGTYSFDSPRGYDRNMSIVSQELDRRKRVSDITAEAQALPGFDTISVYQDPYAATAVGTGDGQAYPSPMDYNLHMDDLQWMINNPPDHAYYLVKDDNPVIQNFFNQGYNLLTDREKGIYNAYIENKQPEKAAAFLEAIGPDLLQRRANANLWFNSSAASNPWLALPYYASATAANFAAGLQAPLTGLGLAIGAISENPNDPYYDALNLRDAVRPEQRDVLGDALNFEIAGHRVGDFLYDTLTGVTDFGLAVAVSSFTGNPSLAGYIMGSEAGASTAHEMLKNGWDGKAAAAAGLFSAAVEAFTEKFSIDALFKNPAAGWRYFLSNAFTEGTEEAAAEILNPVAEAFTGYFFDEETNAQARYYDLVNNQGMTDAEASRALFNEFMNSTAYAAAIGAAVGGVAAGGTSVVQNQLDTRTGQPIAASETGEADLLSLAETMSDNSETKKILPTLKKTKGGKNVKASELGRLARTMAAELDGESHSVLASATASVVRQHLNATGRAQDIHTAAQEVGTTPKVLAETIAKGINGTRMNAEERRIFGKSDFAKSMVRELGLGLKAPTMIKQARLRSITNPTTQVEEQRENAAVVRATQLINPASNDPHSDHLVYEVDGQQAEGDILRFDEVDGELLVVVKDGDGNRAALSRDMITSMDGSTQATVVELVTSGGERISAPKANLMLRAAQYEKPESMASFLTAFDSVYDAGWYGRSMEAVDGLSSDLAADVYALGQNEAKAAEEARVTRDGAFKRVEGGLVTFLGKVKTREELVGEGTVDALTAAEGSLTETQRAHVDGIKAIAKALNAQIVLYDSDADSISDLPNGQYMPDTGLIYLDINAGAETAEGVEAARAAGTLGNAMVTSLSHELTHAIERNSKQGYIDFKQEMIDQFKKRGGPTFEQLVQQKIGEQYANFGIRLTRQAAEAEVVAYGAELMLQNSDVIATLKPSLAEKIRTFIADFLKKVRNAFSIMPSLSTESSALVEMRDGVLKYADDLQKKWNIALQEAVGMEGEAVAAAAQEQAAEAAPVVAETQAAEAAPAAEETQTETAAPVQPTTSEEAPLVTAEEQALQSEEAPPSFDLIAALDGQDQPAGQSEALNKGTEAQATDDSGALYSMRGRGDSITVREYVAEADESLATSNAERNALELYKKRLANYTAITRQLRDARAAVRQAESDEARAQAQANVNTLLGKRASAYDKLVSAESTPHISQIMARTRSFMQENLAGKTREDLEALISRTEAEIAELTEMVAGLEKASRTQSRERKTIVAQLEEAKQSIEDKRRTIAQLRSRATERYLALRQHYEDRIERDRTRRQIMEESRKKERHVKKVVRRLHDKLVNESDTRNIKEPLKPVAIKLVNAFLEGFGRSVFSAQSTAKLYPLYQELAREAGVDTTEFASDISELFEILNETAVRYGEYASHVGNSIEQATLRLQIFDTLADIVDHVDALVRNADATFADGKRTTISLLSDSVYESLADRKNKRTIRGVVGKATQLFSDTTWMGNLLPTYFFEQLGNETLNDLFVDIRRGMSDSMRIVRDAQDFMQDLKKRKHYYSWRLGDTIDIHTAQGHDLHLPVEVAIALYVTAKRERANTIAATRHLQDGGFRMDEDAVKKGIFNPAETSGFHRMSDEDIARLESLLTEDQKSYGDEIATYLAEHMGALGNQVSMATYGIRKYKESYYIPFVTASIQRAQSSSKGSTATTDDSRLAHQSFSHRLRTGANTALQIGNITDMALRHVYSMANYVGMATPIENLNRVLNHNIEAEDGSKSTIRAIFEQKYGKIALKYMEDLMRDVNGTTQSDNRSMGGINFAISAFKRGAVAGKLTVALQQATSIFRAAAYLGIKDFVGIPVARVPSAWQELLKYSGTAIAKDMGRYDIGLGQTAVEYMAQDDMTGFNIFQRVQNRTVKENWKSFTDLTTALPGFMDQFAWVNIFAMVKREQARLHPGMDTSSEEFLKMCGERFDDVVYHTQVFDSVLSRSSLMRSKNAVHMAATSFMAEPTMTLNMLRSAFFGKHTKAERAKIVAGCLVSTIGAAAAAALVGGFNKDDDDRTWWEKYLSNFTSRAIDGLNPMSLFPYFNAVSDYFEGYEAERLDTAVFGDIVTHVKQAYNGNLTPWKTVELLGGDIANLFGLPLGGVMGDMRRIRNAINSSKAAVPADELKFSVLEAAPYGWYKGGTTAYYERMATAAINGDKAEVQAIRNYLLRAYQPDGEKIDSGMKSAMKDRFVAGDVPEGDAINVLVSYGLAKDKNDAYWTVDRWEHKAETGSDDGYSKYNDFTEAVRTGKNLKSVANTYLTNGVDKSNLSDAITSAFKKEYVQLYKTDKRAAAALKARLLTAYELLGYDRTKKSKDIDRWIKD